MAKQSQGNKEATMINVRASRKNEDKLRDRIKVLETKNVEMRKEIDEVREMVKKLQREVDDLKFPGLRPGGL